MHTHPLVFDRGAEDVGNIVHLEHLNLAIPDQQLATQFYVSALGFTRDPHMKTGAGNMWINAGSTQFHLPTRGTQRLRGHIHVVLPQRQALLQRLHGAARPLAHTAYAFHEETDHVAVTCPWGNRFRCFEPDLQRFGRISLGLAQVVFDVPVGSAPGIADFYRQVLAAPAHTGTAPGGLAYATVRAGAWQSLVFHETAADIPAYDGHHIQVYVADFSGPHRRLLERGLVSEESDRYQYRFEHISDPHSGAPLFQIQHEVRSMTHPLYARPLVNHTPL